MLLKNKSGKKSYEARVLSEKKVPKFVRGNYVTKNIKIDGKSVEFKYDKDRKTGLYFRLNNKPLYFAERDILREHDLTTKSVEAEKPEKKGGKTPPTPKDEVTIEPIEG